MRTVRQLIGEATDINACLVREQGGDMQSLLESLAVLETYAARAHEMRAEARALRDAALRVLIEKNLFPEGLTPALKNKYLSAATGEESFAVDFIDGICSSVAAIMDSRRTRISALKEEMRQLRMPDVREEGFR